MSNQTTSQNSTSVISLPGLGDGPTPSASPDGQMINQSGPAPAHASRLAALESEWEKMTKDTCGQISETLSATATLQSSLASRLAARMDVNGSPEYVLTWKSWPMLSGPPICALRGSRRRTSDNAFTGWRTPTAEDGSRGRNHNPSKQAGEFALSTEVHKIITPWPSPSSEGSAGEISEDLERRGEKWVNKKTGRVLQTNLATEARMTMEPWPSPRATSGTGKCEHGDGGMDLQTAAAMTGWATPGMATTGTNPDGSLRKRVDMLPRQVTMAFGEAQSSAKTTKGSGGGYLLNAKFSLWLQGYPAEWALSGERAIASSRS